MNVMWAAVGAVLGLLAGAALRATVFRLSVAPGEPERTACPECGGPMRRRLALRCLQCRRSLGAPLALELGTGVVLALVLGRFGGQPDVVAFGFFGVLGVALAVIDIATQRLPDPLTLPAYPILIILLTAAALAGHDFAALLRAVLGGLALAGAFLLLALVRPGQLGGGDIKLAGLAGLALGWLGWPTLIAGAALGFVLSALVSLALLAARRITMRSAICFGPFLIGGALVAMLASTH
ncbi:MAG TPA: prepilin peptidase [Streptosporangiaceae bacterium]|nr:prepilin peptidase [Streptosporangiaceae bacterium]